MIANYLYMTDHGNIEVSERLNMQADRQGCGAGKFFSGSGSWLFFQAAPAPDFFSQAAPAPVIFFVRLRLQGAKNTRLRFRLLGKIVFSPQTSKVKLQKNNCLF